MEPTKKQKKVLEAIKTFIKDHGYPPTVRDIMKIMGLKSTAGIQRHLENLREKSLINRKKGVSRSITLNQ